MKKTRCRKNKARQPKKMKLIAEYYNKALEQLKSSGGQVGHEILYEMPVDLYDLSIDILYNKNDEFSDSELRSLIARVDYLIYNTNDEDFESDLSDNFNNLF